jgi:ABC-type multidrug transport system fused ATPase/permease subunit
LSLRPFRLFRGPFEEEFMNFLNRFLFSEAGPLVEIAKTRAIEEKDLLKLPEVLNPRAIPMELSKLRWETPFSFLRSLLLTARPFLLRAYSLYFAQALCALATPVLVNRFITTISKGVDAAALPAAIGYGVALGLCGLATGLFIQHYFFYILRCHQLITNIVNEKIFTHSLRLTQGARQKNQLGDIVNFMSSDSDSVAEAPSILGDASISLFMILAVVSMLFYYIGWSALAALSVLAILAPLTRYVAGRFTHLEEQMMGHRDRRVTLMNQTLNAIRVVKYFAWEKSIESEVTTVREQELQSRRRLASAEVVASLGYMAVSTMVLFAALAAHAWRGKPLDAALIFTCVSLFALLEGPFGDLSRLISRATAAFVGAGRILEFLKQETLAPELAASESLRSPCGVRVENLTAIHSKADAPVLKSVSFAVNAGGSVAVVGPVGSGKSSLLYALLGELAASSGAIYFENALGLPVTQPRRSYVPQDAFIINNTLLENLQFGETVTKEELRRAIHNACLAPDLRLWKGGLRTEIGEKGVNLSGGQKQRVALARAELRKPDLVLLDDPLSAVDAETERLLCDRLLFKAWDGVTRVVVTHRLEHLARFDQVIYIENGSLLGQGPFHELLQNCPSFAEFYSEHRRTQGQEEEKIAEVETESNETSMATKGDADSTHRVTEDEDREVGAVKSSVYKDYINSLGGESKKLRPLILFLLFAGAVAATLLPLSQKLWLSYYSNHQSAWQALTAVGIYGLIGLAVLAGYVMNELFWLSRGIRAGKNMHAKMLRSVLDSPVRFFDSTPVGRILQRFSRDIESVDVYLQWSFSMAVGCALQVLVSVVLILSVMPVMAVVILPVMALYYGLQRNYRRPAREAKRFDSVARSPRYAHFKESLQGLVVIRGFHKSTWFLETFYQKLAHSHRMFYSHYMLNRWFSSRISLVGGIISTATTVGIALSAYYGKMNAGTAGLVTIYALSFWGFLNWGVRIFADIESRMTSIERLKFFAHLPSEQSVLKAPREPLRQLWPERGEIKVKNLQIRYASHLPLVLKGVSFEVKPGTRVGIIGRTGSGKSTLFQSLFRFIEAEAGSIEIDGVDIASVPLQKLRRSLAIIPQDPVLFMGTIRNNLDRYNEYSEEEVVASLKHAAMWDYVQSLPLGLQSPVTESGLNLSQGQRQLLCLARALLTKARVIVMDEATASVDVQTDALLQTVIRNAFRGVTMLIIAHRLGTISDCDQVVEITAGEVASITSPEAWSEGQIQESLV